MPTTPSAAQARTRPADPAIAGHAAYLAAAWVASPDHWRHLVRHVPGERWYAPLFSIPGAAGWLITWAPNTGLPAHDHGGAAGTLAVVRGELRERFTTTERAAAGAPAWEARRLAAGSLTSFASDHVHEVVNRGVEPAVSIHVYAPGLDEMVFYDALPSSSELTKPRKP
jgi:hypothetical protein